MKRIDHIGIAVRDLHEAEKVFTDVLGVGPFKKESVDDESVQVSFFQAGESKVELLESTTEKRGEGLHHVAFHVDDLDAELKRLKELGYRIISGPKSGADNKTIAFLHPADANKVLIELCADSA